MEYLKTGHNDTVLLVCILFQLCLMIWALQYAWRKR